LASCPDRNARGDEPVAFFVTLEAMSALRSLAKPRMMLSALLFRFNSAEMVFSTSVANASRWQPTSALDALVVTVFAGCDRF